MFRDSGNQVFGSVSAPWVNNPSAAKASYDAFWDAATQGGGALEAYRAGLIPESDVAFDGLRQFASPEAE